MPAREAEPQAAFRRNAPIAERFSRLRFAYTSSMIAISAASPRRMPVRIMRV